MNPAYRAPHAKALIGRSNTPDGELIWQILPHHHHKVRYRHRLVLRMGDVDECDLELALQTFQFPAHTHAAACCVSAAGAELASALRLRAGFPIITGRSLHRWAQRDTVAGKADRRSHRSMRPSTAGRRRR